MIDPDLMNIIATFLIVILGAGAAYAKQNIDVRLLGKDLEMYINLVKALIVVWQKRKALIADGAVSPEDKCLIYDEMGPIFEFIDANPSIDTTRSGSL